MKPPIELTEPERATALEALRSARDDGLSPVSTLACVLDAINRHRTT